jgi:hypothetical protein
LNIPTSFLQILEFCPIFWNLKQLENDKNHRTATGLKPAHGLRRLARRFATARSSHTPTR